MRLLIFIGMVIIFISAFFMFFIFDTAVKNSMQCLTGIGTGACESGGSMFDLVLALCIIGFFVLIDIGVVYIVMSSITSESSVG